MEIEEKIAMMYLGFVSVGAFFVSVELYKYLYNKYKRKCAEVERNKEIIDDQKKLIKELLKEQNTK